MSESINFFKDQPVFNVKVYDDDGSLIHDRLFFKEEDAQEYSKKNQKAWNPNANRIKKINIDYIQDDKEGYYPISYSDRIL